jgi:hypothetical protein
LNYPGRITDMHTGAESLHTLAFDRAAADPFFVGRRLADLRREQGLAPMEQAAALGLSLDALAYLALCRMPGPGETTAVERIAGKIGMAPGRLAQLLGIGSDLRGD